MPGAQGEVDLCSFALRYPAFQRRVPRRTTSGKIISALHLLSARPRNYGCVASILTVPGEIAPESEVELRILYSSLWPGGSWKLSNAAWKFSFGHAGKAASENGMRPGKTAN